MKVIPSVEINHRTDFALLCNARGITEAAEVGVDMATFADDFLARWHGRMLYLIDPYLPYAEIPGDRTADILTAVQRMSKHQGRFKFYMIRSVEAADVLPDWVRPRFVYIDAAHDYDSARMDIEAWWNRIPDDGVLAGHDYDPTHPGVVRAVNEFSEINNAVVRLTMGDAPGQVSWYAYKTEPRKLVRRFFVSDEIDNPEF